jgi:hypothetical protein
MQILVYLLLFIAWAVPAQQGSHQPATPSASAIDPDWQKFQPAVTEFTNADNLVCKDGGDDKDRTTYRYKNRTDTAEDHNTDYHKVTLKDILALPYFQEEKTAFDAFTKQADKEEIMKYQGIPVEVEGFLADDLRNEHAEATNCRSNAATDVDWHLVVAEQGKTAADSVFAEITPRVRHTHPNWKKADFKEGAHLRIQGWLLYDPDHKNQMTEHMRGTLWEVHPIMKVWKQQTDGTWLDLDEKH